MARTASKQSLTDTIEHITVGLAPLTEQEIAAQTDANSFKRGRGYARSGHIFRAVRRENTLRARSHGSSGGPYLVEATLAKADQAKRKMRNPVTYSCDCPRGGFCKHVVALLLTWIEQPETFEVRPPVAEVLAKKSREELVALIGMMLRETPDFEDLLDLPVLIAGAPGDEPVDERAIRRQITAAMRDTNGYGRGGWYDGGSYAATRIAGKLDRLTALASAYADAGDWRNAVRVSATFVEELAPQYQPYYDQNSGLASLLSQTDDTLADVLDAQDGLTDDSRLSTDERKRLIDAILTIWATDINPGVDFSYHGPEAIARGATAAEQHYVADWLRRWMQSLGSNEPNWYKQAAIRFLSTLAGDAGLSHRELLAEYRNAALWEDATALLLELDHIDEAVALAARHLNQPATLLPFADRLLATRNPRRIEQAISLVDDLLWEHEGENIRADQALREWLEKQYARYGKPEKALEIARSRFKATPNKSTFDAVKTAALLLDQTAHPWAPLRKELLAALRKGSEWYALMDIHLELGEVADALKALEQSSQKSKRAAWSYGWGVSPDQYAARIAAAAEQDFPDDAVRLYQQVAESLIGARNRPSYQNAAGYLARIWNVLETHGRGEEWPRLIGELRQRFKTFRALQEELDVLGLR